MTLNTSQITPLLKIRPRTTAPARKWGVGKWGVGKWNVSPTDGQAPVASASIVAPSVVSSAKNPVLSASPVKPVIKTS